MIWVLLFLLAALGLMVFLGTSALSEDIGVDPVAHYRAQLEEIDADEARAAIDAESAHAARLELKRRLLRADKTAKSADLQNGAALSARTKVTFAAVIVAAAGGLYSLLGAPTAPAAPASPREQAANQLVDETGLTLGQAVAQIRAHLNDNPRDMQGWQVLAQTARSMGDFVSAAEAFGELANMDPAQPNWRASEFEAFLAHGGGQVTPAARLVLAALLDQAPDHPAGQYYLGLAHLQAGDENRAKVVWTALADRSAADAPWMPQLRQQLAALGLAPPALSERDMAVVDGMSEEEREVFMQSMLERLEARLDSDPSDADGWMMLARSKLALGDEAGAIAALERGIAANSAENTVLMQALLDNLQNKTEF